MDGHDVGVVERCDHTGLFAKPVEKRLVGRKTRMQDLDRYFSIEICVVRLVDGCGRSATHATHESVPIAELITDAYGVRLT